MAAKYARAAGGNWSADATWSTTDGGAADTVKPTAADDVFLTATSGAVTIDAASVAKSLTCTGYTNTLTHNAFTLTVSGSVTLVSGMTYSTVSFASLFLLNTTGTFTSGGKSLAALTFDGVGQTFTIADNISFGGVATRGITLTNGTLKLDGASDNSGLSHSTGIFSSSNSNTRTITMGNCTITCTATSANNAWDITTATNLTFTKGGSTITLNGAGSTFYGGGQSYNVVNLTGSGTQSISGANTFVTLNRTGTAAKTDALTIQINQTVSGTITLAGNSTINRLQVLSNTVGTARTITAATVSCSNTDFQDITGAGAGSWDFSASTTIGDCQGNSGITFPASVAQYYGGVNLNGSYLRLNGISGNYVSAPDSAALSITGDLTIDVKVALDDWTPSAQQDLVSKYLSAGNQRAYMINVQADGTLGYISSVDGTLTGYINLASSAATGVTNGATKWLRVTHDVDNGAAGNDVKFYTSDDGSSWTQLGTTRTTAGVTTRIDTTALLEIGSSNLGGNGLIAKVYQARIYSDITQTTKVFDADFTAQSAGTKSFTESSSQAATVSLTVTGGNWSASSWTTRVPLPQDDVYMGNAFAASQTVTATMPRLGRNIDWNGASGSPTFALTSTGNGIFGSLTLISGMTISRNQTLTFSGRSIYTITSSGNSFGSSDINLSFPTGTYTLQDSFLSTGQLQLLFGSFNTSSMSVTVASFNNSNSNTRALTLGTSTITLTSTAAGSLWVGTTSTGLTLSADNSSIIYSTASANTRNFTGGSKSYGTLTYTVAGSTGELDITGSNSFAAINFSDVTNARSLKFTAGTTTTIRNGNGFNVRGTSGKLMTIDTITGASTFTLTSPNQQSTDYITPTRSTVDASPKWYAGANATDGTGNTNWIFTNSPESVNSFTQYTAQQCLNFIYGTPDTQYSLQEIANLYNGTPSTKLSFQEVLNHREGLPPNARSAQEALFENVKTVLGLSDPYTQYSVQYLLNLCKSRGIGLSTIFG